MVLSSRGQLAPPHQGLDAGEIVQEVLAHVEASEVDEVLQPIQLLDGVVLQIQRLDVEGCKLIF